MRQGLSRRVVAGVGATALGSLVALSCEPAAKGQVQPDLRSEGVAYGIAFEHGSGTLLVWVRSEAEDLVAVDRYALGVRISGVQGLVPTEWNRGTNKARAPAESDWVALRNGQTATWTLSARGAWREALRNADSPTASFGDEPSPMPAFFAKEKARVWAFPKDIPIEIRP
ncbi:MAG: hypothetical protein KIS66_04465 [Fimbriimonadaceae bacterium]|nr:hypothetical protein [Fimbriimonadaceae bacterium]